MGRNVGANAIAAFGPQKLQFLCRIRSLLTSIRALSHLARTSCHVIEPQRSYFNSQSSACKCAWRISPKRSKQRPLRTVYLGLKPEAKFYGFHVSRLYTTSNRGTFKAEPPVGIYTDRKDNVQMQWMQITFGDSFKRLSRHINMYFKREEMSSTSFPGVQKQAQTFNSADGTETKKSRQVQYSFVRQSQESHSTPGHPGLQLFHKSSLVTKFGESYSYVAGHINSAFSKQVRKDVPSSDDILGRSPKNASKHPMAAAVDVNNSDLCMSMEEGYLHFARHINRYFGAKVTDGVVETPQHRGQALETPKKGEGHLPSQDTLPLRPKSLFHMSNLTTHFGENYAYMATHINRYFKSSADEDEHLARDPSGGQSGDSTENQTSLFQSLLNPFSIQRLVESYMGKVSGSPSAVDSTMDKVAVRRQLAEDRTRLLLANLEKAKTRSTISSCVEELNTHLILNPTCKNLVWQDKSAMHLLKNRRLFAMDESLQAAFRETLALIGLVDPLKGWGIRVLSIDGGGTRGVVPLQVLKELEARTGKRVSELFDYVCGVSTGAILAFMLALAHFSIDECEEMYRRFGSDVFRQNPLVGTVKMGWSHSYYNTETWETILKEKIGDQLLVRTARNTQSPKVSAVSAVVNWGTSPKPFIFRNYNHPPGRLSRHAGGSGYQLWQAVRASSAAPGYFQEFPLYNDIHQDGGIILNNPSALAVHESRLLWPNEQFQCVLSLGTGRYDNAKRGPATSTSLRAKISHLISSATDTEGVHTLLADLMEPKVYFRFNPMLSAEVSLDESRPGALKQLQLDTQKYLERNEAKLNLLHKVLAEERTTLGKTRDWINEKTWQLQQRWA